MRFCGRFLSFFLLLMKSAWVKRVSKASCWYIFANGKKFVSVPSASVPRTKKNIAMKCRAVFINCGAMPQSPRRCRQTPVEAAALFSYCLEVVSAQVSLPICHKWVIRVILKQRELSLISQFHLQTCDL